MRTGSMPEKKKGLHPLAWVAIGCGAIVVIGGVVAVAAGVFFVNKGRDFAKEMEKNPAWATARLIAAANPDIEIAGDDRDAKTITFRNVKTGETMTVSYEDIEKGKVTFSSDGKAATMKVGGGANGQGAVAVKTDQGTATIGAAGGEPPTWLPIYPGVTPQGTFSARDGDTRGGAFVFRTSSSLEQVADFYVRELKKAALKIGERTTMPGAISITAATADGKRWVMVVAGREGSETDVTVQFSEKRP